MSKKSEKVRKRCEKLQKATGYQLPAISQEDTEDFLAQIHANWHEFCWQSNFFDRIVHEALNSKH